MTRILTIFTIVAWAQAATADWQLVPASSTLAFTSTKNEVITEVHTFPGLEGSITSDGTARLAVNLLSVATMIPIRDDRMRSFLFDEGPGAAFVAEVPLAGLERQLEGGAAKAVLRGKLEINGGNFDLEVPVIVNRLPGGNVQVLGGGTLDVAMLGYSSGIERLREIAGLQIIDMNTTYTFSLEWQAD